MVQQETRLRVAQERGHIIAALWGSQASGENSERWLQTRPGCKS